MAADSNGHSILIVDDLPQNLKLLTHILTKRGYSVQPAISGQLAIRHLEFHTPDLIILDVKMPEMNGYELCSKIKSNTMFSSIPVIFISNLNEIDDKINGFKAGGVDFITKPFHEAEVLARVETHLTLWNLQKQLNIKNIELQKEIAERERAESAILDAYNKVEIEIRNRTEDLRKVNLELINKEAKVRGILNAVPDLLFVLNKEGKFLEYIAKSEEDLYISPSFFLEKNISEVMPKHIAKTTLKKIRIVLTTGETQIFEYKLVINGSNKYFESRLAIGEQEQVVCLIRDITSRKTAEEKIQNINDELEIKVKQRTKELIALNKKLEELSRTDPLTGLSNRRNLIELFEIEKARALRKRTTFALLIGDIDHFKEINDTYGHECGDVILKQIALILRNNVRLDDIVSRYGGDEFVILLSEIKEADALATVEKLRLIVENDIFVYENIEINITMSFGAGIFDGVSAFSGNILEIDKCLYEAKKTGRNKSVILNLPNTKWEDYYEKP